MSASTHRRMSALTCPMRHEFFIGVEQEVGGVDRTLASLAAYRYGFGTEPGHEHTVCFNVPLWPGTEMSVVLLMRPRIPIVPDLVLDDRRHVVLLQVITLHASERAYKMR